MAIISVLSFSWREKSREISFKLGQLKTYRVEPQINKNWLVLNASKYLPNNIEA
jgi:uncharacterized protein YjbK